MKKYLYLFSYMALALVFLSGCRNYVSSISAVETKNTITKTASSKNIDTVKWKPTTFGTVNNFEGVTMTVKEETVSSSKLTLIFKNDSDSQCIYGEDFILEKKLNGKWYQVPVVIKDSYGFNTIGYNLASGETQEFTVDWKWLYGSLDKGEYRIVKDILDFRGTGDYDTYILTTEISIN